MVKYKDYTDFGLSRDFFYALRDSMEMLSSSDVIVIIPEEKYSLYFYYPVKLRDRIQEIAGDMGDDPDYMLDCLNFSRNNKPRFYFKEFTITKKNIDITWKKGSYSYIRYEEDFSMVFNKLQNEEYMILSFEKWIKKLSLNDKKSLIKCILKFNKKPCVESSVTFIHLLLNKFHMQITYTINNIQKTKPFKVYLKRDFNHMKKILDSMLKSNPKLKGKLRYF